MVLVPSTMQLLGDRNWWLPGWLDRLLPNLDIEGELRRCPSPSTSVRSKPPPVDEEPRELVGAGRD